MHSLHLANAAGEKFMRAIKPYCRVKGPELEIALKFRSTFASYGSGKKTPKSIMVKRRKLREKLIQFRHAKPKGKA